MELLAFFRGASNDAWGRTEARLVVEMPRIHKSSMKNGGSDDDFKSNS